jgi:hypothetical protein
VQLTGSVGWKAQAMMQLSVLMSLSGALPVACPSRAKFQVATAPGMLHQPSTSYLQ